MQEVRTSRLIGHNGFFIFLVGTVLFGVLLGAVCFCYMSVDFLSQISLAEDNFLEIRRNSDYAMILMRSFSGSTLFLGAVFLLGFSAVAQPLEIVVLALKGMGLGAVMSQIYAGGGSEGILICVLLLVPSAVISAYALVLGAREAVEMSNLIMTNTLSDRVQTGMLDRVKLYGTRFMVLEAITTVSAAVDCLCTMVFINKI